MINDKIMRRANSSSWKISIIAAALMNMLAVNGQAALDPPHDASNATSCVSCHHMTSTYPKLLPPLNHTPVDGDIDDTTSNSLCWSCHNDPMPLECRACHTSTTAPYVLTHSSLTTSNKYGDWTVECWVCHNQHMQEQKVYGNTSGYIRRSINLANIKGADGNTFIDKNGTAKGGTKSVIFKGETGPNSFADGEPTAIDGICEVCHTKTNAWLNDGTLAGEGLHSGQKGSSCINCHHHENGFQPGAVCLDCHTDSVNNRTAIGIQFSSNSHHVQTGAPVTSDKCYQCHWEADPDGKFTDYHSATPNAAVDLVIYDNNNDGVPGARPTSFSGSTAIAYTADGSRSQILRINDHCLGCHNDDLNNYRTDDDSILGGGIFSDGKAPNEYAWDGTCSIPQFNSQQSECLANDAAWTPGTSVDARYSQTDPADQTTWGKYTDPAKAPNAAKKNITKAYSAHGNAQNNYGGGWLTSPTCLGPNISQDTCPDLGGTWNPVDQQCGSITAAECAQNFCSDFASQAHCQQAVGIWGASSEMCKNISQYTCSLGFCVLSTANYGAESNNCTNSGGIYRYNGTGYVCLNISQSACQAYGYQWQATNGTWKTGGTYYADGFESTLLPTRGGASAKSIACFDCHNSHGSSAGDAGHPTTSYQSATTHGGVLKDTVGGKGGYTASYTPKAGGSTATHNAYNPGAALCFDCHMNESGNATLPWGYKDSFGATKPILGYYDSLFFGYGTFPSQQRYGYKTGMANHGGHFGASNSLKGLDGDHDGDEALHPINHLCTPCHDPHGVSPTLDQPFAVPLLKGTWVTSPYKEDVAPESNTQESVHAVNAGTVYHIDQNTFASNINAAVTGVEQTDSEFAGLCLRCHPKDHLTDGIDDGDWQSVDRIHESVKGWRVVPQKHVYTCSKCHTPHNSRLPRLMVTNCLNTDHKGRVQDNPSPVLSGSGANRCLGQTESWDCYHLQGGTGTGHFPGTGIGDGSDNGYWTTQDPPGSVITGSYTYTVTCHEFETGNTYDQSWNTVTQWDNTVPAPPTLATPTATEEADPTSWTLGANITADGGSAIAARGTVYGTSPSPIDNAEDEGGFATGGFTQTRSGLLPGTKYYYRGYATNSTGIGYSPDGSFFTEPSGPVANVDIASTATSVTITWERESNNGTLVLMKQEAAVDFVPLDGTFTGYLANSSFGGGAQMGIGNYVVYKGSGTSAVVTGLTPNTTYYVALYEYQGAADTVGVYLGTNYYPVPATDSFTTINGGTFTYAHTGSVQTLLILSNAANIQLTVKGAGGGGGMYDARNDQTNGLNGHLAVATYATTGDMVGGPNQAITLSIFVAGGGQIPTGNAGADGGGGNPVGGDGQAGEWDNDYDNAWGGAGGGGASSIYNDATRLVEAAGGAGGTSAGYDPFEGCCSGGSGGTGGGTDYPGTTSATGGGVGGLRGNTIDLPTVGGEGQVKITYDLP